MQQGYGLDRTFRQLHNIVATQNRLASFIEDLLFTVVHSDPEPVMARPTIIDVTFKEFVNLGERENDETIIRVGKNLPIASGTRYHFTMSEGVKFDHKYNFGPQIVGLCMTGGYMSVGKNYSIKDQSYNDRGTDVQLPSRGEGDHTSKNESKGQDRHVNQEISTEVHPRVQYA